MIRSASAALLVLMLLIGCGGGSDGETDTLRLSMGEEAQSLDPAFAVDQGFLLSGLFDPLEGSANLAVGNARH